jgi:hypothetical protein
MIPFGQGMMGENAGTENCRKDGLRDKNVVYLVTPTFMGSRKRSGSVLMRKRKTKVTCCHQSGQISIMLGADSQGSIHVL